jgi:histidyl-tRNA synthetase
MGVGEYCRLDWHIIRGLAYYTGIVYEVFDTGESLRAVAGGGRYDNLLQVLGGPSVGATGFGMGDVVLGILLEEKGKLPQLEGQLDVFVIDGGDAGLSAVMQTVGALRRQGVSADFSYKTQPIGKQLKEANRRCAKRAVIIKGDKATVKDLATGEQQEMTLAALLAPSRAQ